MLRILIADDHSIVRIGTSIILRDELGEVEIAEAGTFSQVLEKISERPFDLILLDISMPGGDTLDMVPSILLRNKDARVLIFSSYDESMFALRYIQSGAHGYLGKDTGEEEVKLAVRTVLKGDIYVSEKLKQYQLSRIQNHKDPLAELSDRETEIMQLLIKGYSTSEIANLLHLRLNTISTYKVRLYEKLKVSNLVELIGKVKLLRENGTI